MLHSVTLGCTSVYEPTSISARPSDEKHAVRCCDDTGTTCTTPRPCHLASTYYEAVEICSKHGLRLCTRNEKLDDICCGTGCELDSTTMWIADDPGMIPMVVKSYCSFLNLKYAA